MINTFDPEEVVIGGGGRARGRPAARSGQARRHAVTCCPGSAAARRSALARHGVRAGVLGAGLLAVHELAHRGAPAPDTRCARDRRLRLRPCRVSVAERLLAVIAEGGHEVLDLGTDQPVPVDYPDKALEVGRAVVDGRAERGVLVCGSGAGVRSPPARSTESGRRRSTTPTPVIRQSSTTASTCSAWARGSSAQRSPPR